MSLTDIADRLRATGYPWLAAQVEALGPAWSAGSGVYVAGGGSERLTVARPWIDALAARGVVITYDWTRDPGWDDPAALDAYTCARTDLDAVRRAAVVWYLAPADKSEGSAAELGAALALGKRVVVSGPHMGALGRIFPALACARCATHAEAFEVVLDMATWPAEPPAVDALVAEIVALRRRLDRIEGRWRA